jgi:hypothetical protein
VFSEPLRSPKANLARRCYDPQGVVVSIFYSRGLGTVADTHLETPIGVGCGPRTHTRKLAQTKTKKTTFSIPPNTPGRAGVTGVMGAPGERRCSYSSSRANTQQAAQASRQQQQRKECTLK